MDPVTSKLLLVLILGSGQMMPPGIPEHLSMAQTGRTFNTVKECVAAGDTFVGKDNVKGYLCLYTETKGTKA